MNKKDICKRKRSENWIEEDKMLLKDLVRQNVRWIENKNTDTNSNQLKKKAWRDVEESFNDLCTGGQRNLTQLKNQWVATKIAARKEFSQHRKEIFKTGGGPQPQEMASSSNDISSWLPNEFMQEENKFDSDFITDNLKVEILEDEDKAMLRQNDIVNDGTKVCEETDFTPKSIKRKRELHELQMDVEKKRQRNLDKEYSLLTAQEEINKLKIEAEKKRLRNLDAEHDMLIAKRMFYENESPTFYRNIRFY